MFAQKANESIESLDLRFAEILNELEALGEVDAYSESDKALAIIRSLNDQWSMQKASYQTHNTHNTETYISILETLKNVENEKVLNSSSQADTCITELALAAASALCHSMLVRPTTFFSSWFSLPGKS